MKKEQSERSTGRMYDRRDCIDREEEEERDGLTY